MNKHQEFLDLIEELNEQIAENKFFENLGIGFSYSTTGYSDLIKFGNFTLYCSENDSLSEWDGTQAEQLLKLESVRKWQPLSHRLRWA